MGMWDPMNIEYYRIGVCHVHIEYYRIGVAHVHIEYYRIGVAHVGPATCKKNCLFIKSVRDLTPASNCKIPNPPLLRSRLVGILKVLPGP